MSRPVRVLFLTCAMVAVSALAVACGTQRISVPKSQPQLYRGAVLFSQRCSGCHTLSYAATHGSAANVRTAQLNNGPDFDVRCERPIARVLYAIENGGFSGVIMPQNVVVGQDAIDVAKFVATYAGRQAPKIPNVTPCIKLPIGTIPSPATAPTKASTPHSAASARKRASAKATTKSTSSKKAHS